MVALALALLLVAWAWLRTPPVEPVPLTVGTGLPGGVYHSYGAGLAEVTRDTATPVTALETPASVANLRMVAGGQVDAGFTLADVAALAVAGEAPFTEPLPVQAIARLYDNHTHLVVRAPTPYQQIEDLAGTTVSVGAPDSGTELVAERLLALAGLGEDSGVSVVRLGLEESAAALQEGQIEAFFWSGGIPTGAVSALAAQTPIRLLDLAAYVPVISTAHGDYFTELPVPAGTYPGVPGIRTIGVPSLLVVNAAMPEPVAHDFTASLFQSRDELARIHPVALQLTPRSAIATLPVPLHPGASRYFEEIKLGHDAGG